VCSKGVATMAEERHWSWGRRSRRVTGVPIRASQVTGGLAAYASQPVFTGQPVGREEGETHVVIEGRSFRSPR
jgi:hypothetical protein